MPCFALLCCALLCIALHCFALLCIALLGGGAGGPGGGFACPNSVRESECGKKPPQGRAEPACLAGRFLFSISFNWAGVGGPTIPGDHGSRALQFRFPLAEPRAHRTPLVFALLPGSVLAWSTGLRHGGEGQPPGVCVPWVLPPTPYLSGSTRWDLVPT